MQFQGNLLIQIQENSEKLHFVPDLGPFRKIFFSKIWQGQSLDIMVSYHHVQYQKKLIIQS